MRKLLKRVLFKDLHLSLKDKPNFNKDLPNFNKDLPPIPKNLPPLPKKRVHFQDNLPTLRKAISNPNVKFNNSGLEGKFHDPVFEDFDYESYEAAKEIMEIVNFDYDMYNAIQIIAEAHSWLTF